VHGTYRDRRSGFPLDADLFPGARSLFVSGSPAAAAVLSTQSAICSLFSYSSLRLMAFVIPPAFPVLGAPFGPLFPIGFWSESKFSRPAVTFCEQRGLIAVLFQSPQSALFAGCLGFS